MKAILLFFFLLPLLLSGQTITDSILRSLHNPEDRLDSSQGWSWLDHPEIGILETRSFFEYDGEGRLVVQLVMKWDGIQWNNSDKFSYAYTTGGKVTVYTSQAWNNDQWENQEQLVFTLDDHDDLISTMKLIFDGINWVFSTLETYSYNDVHQLLEWVSGQWMGSAWQNEIQKVYSYDQDQHLVLLFVSAWDGVQWNDQSQITYAYDANDNLIRELGQKFVFGGWHNEYRHDFEYDENHNVTSFVQYHAGGDTYWEKSHRSLYAYDSFQNLVSEVRQYNLKDFWFDSGRNLYQYDDRQNKIASVLQDWDAGWKNLDSTHYYYSLALGIQNVPYPETGISLYPNPATTTIQIQFPGQIRQLTTLEIISNEGVQVLKESLVPHSIETIDISSLVPGSYHLLIQSRKSISICDFIKL